MTSAEVTAYSSRPHPMLGEAVELLRSLVRVPSFSRQEDATAGIWEEWLGSRCGVNVFRTGRNIWAIAPGFDSSRPTLMLNSHHDTVRPAKSYTRDPFSPDVEGGRLYGLGSNDAGASGVSLASAFISLHGKTFPFNLLLAITAEEEVSGENGMRLLLPALAAEGIVPGMAIVGEPTCLQPAVAERGLVVIDAVARGKSGHAARNEGINAIYRAISDIERLRNFAPERVSETLGPMKVSVTMVNAGTQHNAVPDTCTYVADVRTTDAYTNEETVRLLRETVEYSELTPRSTRIHASVIAAQHPLVRAAAALGKTPFVSPTTSDMALMPGIPSLKIGPGDSARSHTADEYVELDEINEALHFYPKLVSLTASQFEASRL